MQGLLSVLGSLAGLAGLLLCLVAGAWRLSGGYFLAGFELITLFQCGIALVVVACFLKLEGIERLP